MVYSFLVTFELRNKKRKYTSFYKKLESMGNDRRKLFNNCWYIKVEPPIETLDVSHTGTNWEVSRRKEKPKSAQDLFEELEATLSPGDSIYVTQLVKNYDYGLLSKDNWSWIRE